MDVLLIATVYNHLAAFHKPFIKDFQLKGYKVHVAGSNSMGRKDELEEMGVICHDIDFDKNVVSRKNLTAIKQLNELFKNTHFHLIHVHTPIAAFITRYVYKKYKSQGQLLYTAHGFYFYKGAPLKSWLLYYTAEVISRRWTSSILVMNKEDLQLAERIGYKREENLFFVNGVGVDFEEFNTKIVSTQKIRDELNIPSNGVIFSCVAELRVRKNQEFILKNWMKIVQERPDFHLLLVGEGSEEKKYKELVKENNISNVHFLGFRKDIPKIMNESDIILLTSLHEGLPRCLMEALALGKPVIASNVRGTNDLIEDSKNGFLIDLNENQEFISKAIKLGSDKSLQNEYGNYGKDKSYQYSIENVMKQMELIYDKTLNKSNLSRSTH